MHELLERKSVFFSPFELRLTGRVQPLELLGTTPVFFLERRMCQLPTLPSFDA